jgi:hypothetical protein
MLLAGYSTYKAFLRLPEAGWCPEVASPLNLAVWYWCPWAAGGGMNRSWFHSGILSSVTKTTFLLRLWKKDASYCSESLYF